MNGGGEELSAEKMFTAEKMLSVWASRGNGDHSSVILPQRAPNRTTHERSRFVQLYREPPRAGRQAPARGTREPQPGVQQDQHDGVWSLCP